MALYLLGRSRTAHRIRLKLEHRVRATLILYEWGKPNAMTLSLEVEACESEEQKRSPIGREYSMKLKFEVVRLLDGGRERRVWCLERRVCLRSDTTKYQRVFQLCCRRVLWPAVQSSQNRGGSLRVGMEVYNVEEACRWYPSDTEIAQQIAKMNPADVAQWRASEKPVGAFWRLPEDKEKLEIHVEKQMRRDRLKQLRLGQRVREEEENETATQWFRREVLNAPHSEEWKWINCGRAKPQLTTDDFEDDKNEHLSFEQELENETVYRKVFKKKKKV